VYIGEEAIEMRTRIIFISGATIIIIAVGIGLISINLHTTWFGVNRMNAARYYVRAIHEHLQARYDEPFHVDPQWHSPGRGPVLSIHRMDMTPYFFAHPLSDPTYVFTVTVRRNSDFEIDYIRENYFWRFVRQQLQEYIKSYFYDLLGSEMIVYIELRSRQSSNGDILDTLNRNSTIEDFFASDKKIAVFINIFIPNYDPSLSSTLAAHVHGLTSRLIETGRFEYRNRFRMSSLRVTYVNCNNAYALIDTSVDETVRALYFRHNNRSFAYMLPFWDPNFTRNSMLRAVQRRRPYMQYYNSLVTVFNASFYEIFSPEIGCDE